MEKGSHETSKLHAMPDLETLYKNIKFLRKVNKAFKN